MRKLLNEELDRLSTEAFKEADKLPLIVVLDNVRSMNNIGSVFRTGDAFRIEAIYLCGITATPPNKEIHKTALGATDSVQWHYAEHTAEVISDLKERGFTICAVEQAEGSDMLQEFTIWEDGKYVLVFGHEIKGVEQEVVDLSDLVLEIPQQGTKHSLNISVSAGIVLWEFYKKMKAVL
jgi:23S rRNA (guanosine2251-2'-O)-methyltransferase